MAAPFQILLVDNNPSDIGLIKNQLDCLDITADIYSANNKQQFENFLQEQGVPDLVICDYHLPGYKGVEALTILREKHSYLPFLFTTGDLSEQEAVELMQKGVSDVITKQNIERLGPAVARDLKNFRHRQELEKEIETVQGRFRKLVEQGGDVVVVLGSDGNPTYITPSVRKIFGYTVQEALHINVSEVTHPEDFKHVKVALKKAEDTPGKNISVPPVRMKLKDGSWRWFKISVTDLRHEPSVEGIVNNIRDIHEQVLNARANTLMLNNTEDSFIYINRDLIIQSFNNRFANNYKDIFGIKVQKGDSILDYADPKRREIVKDIYDRVFDGATIENDLEMNAAGGDKRYFHIKYKPAYDKSGDIIGSFISLLETTKEKKAQLELQSKESRFRALVENGSDILFILQPDGNPKYISPSIKNVLGYTAEEAMQIDMMEKAHPDDVEMIMDEIQKCLDHPGVPLKVPPARLKDKDGSWHWFEGTITNMLHDPAIEGIVDNFHEITDRIEAEQKTAEAKNQYQSLIQTVDGIVWEADAKTLIFNYVSPQAKKILGYSPDEWIGEEGFWQNRIHPEDQERAISFCSRQTDKGVNHTFEYRMKKADGEYIWLRDVVTVVKDQGEVKSLRGLMIDINQEKELEIKLDHAYKLSKIGNWELNVEKSTLYWSKFIRELHEVGSDYKPELESAIEFYKEGWSRNTISEAVENAVENGKPFDVELPIITAEGNERWIRAVGQPDFVDGKCVRLYGSTQDIHTRKKAELELESAYKEKETILESIGDGFFTLNRDWIVTYWNSAAEELLHTPKQKILGKNIWDVFSDATDLPSYKNYYRAMEERVAVNFEDYYEPIDSWFDINAYPSEDGISVYFKDITERKANEEKIKRYNERFQKVTEATNDAIWDYDANKEDLFWGKGFETLFGYDLEKTDPSFDFLLSLIHPDDRDRVTQKIQAFMRDSSRKDWFEEYRFKKANGDYAYVMDRAVFIRNDEDRVVRVVGAMTDLTQQVEEEKQLKLYESVVTNTQESIVITEAQPSTLPGRKILYVNEAFTDMTGYTRNEVLGNTLNFLNGPKTDEETLQKLRDAIENYESLEVEFINYKKNGDEFWINTSMVPVSDSKGNYIHWVAIGRDVTSRRNYEDEIQTSLAEKETLLAEIHHRVKNNLAVISGMMQLQAFESDNADLQDKLFDSVSRIKTMATVHELLYQTSSFSDIDFSKTLEYLIRNVSKTLQSNGSSEVNIESEPIKLNINQAIPVSLIVNEVITNAYKHAFKDQKSGKIDIDFREKDKKMVLEIKDNGVGLPAEFNKNDLSSMGLKLISVLSDQIDAEYDFKRLDKGTKFALQFERSNIRGVGNVYMD